MVIGHEWAVELLKRSLALNHLAHAYLFVGPPRIGKTTLALFLARAVNCLNEGNRPCGICTACQAISRGVHPDVQVIDEEGGSIKIAQIRALQKEAALFPFEGRRRVYILCNFQHATLEAANCLLKTLEEPPSSVLFILTADKVEGLLPTIVSRCQVLKLRPLAAEQVERALKTYWGTEPSQARKLARLSGGRMGWAIEASSNDALLLNRKKYLIALEQALGQGRTERMKLAQQLSQSPEVLPELLGLWQNWWRDLLLAKSGNVHAMTDLEREPTVLDEVQQYTLNEIWACLRAIEHAAEQIEQNVNPCLALEVLLLSLPQRNDSKSEIR
nr:DNA polymerase III subunit delta' [Chloroflexota bacterium]